MHLKIQKDYQSRQGKVLLGEDCFRYEDSDQLTNSRAFCRNNNDNNNTNNDNNNNNYKKLEARYSRLKNTLSFTSKSKIPRAICLRKLVRAQSLIDDVEPASLSEFW